MKYITSFLHQCLLISTTLPIMQTLFTQRLNQRVLYTSLKMVSTVSSNAAVNNKYPNITDESVQGHSFESFKSYMFNIFTYLEIDMSVFSPSKISIPVAVKNGGKRSVVEQMSAASVASAAVVAAAAVNAAVGMRSLSAPDNSKSYVYMNGASEDRIGKVDEAGLPLVYDKDLIQAYWKKQGSALTQRWAEFLGYAIPFLTKVVTILVTGGSEELKENGATLARDVRLIFEKLVLIN